MARLTGRAKTEAEAICQHIRGRLPQYPSARQQRKHLGRLISKIADFPIDVDRLAGNVPDWVVEAVRDRRVQHLASLAKTA